MEILCPYCCSRFQADQVHFRLIGPLEDVVEEKEEIAEEDSLSNTVGRQRSTKKQSKNENNGKKLDERLYNYYKEYLNNEAAARQDAMQFGYVEFDVMNAEIDYNRQELREYGYVNKIKYRNQELTTRLCPNCHKNLVRGAGKYPMYMFSVIGDTNVGKSIYLTVLAEMIRQRVSNASMFFVGTKEERDYYRATSKRVMQDRRMLTATIGKVPPLNFVFTYNIKDENEQIEKKKVLITLCDIPGEMCRDRENLEIYGSHLRASSGLMFLIDPTRFRQVKHIIDQGAEIDDGYQREVIEEIYSFLVADSHETSVGIPTAIIITKSDTLKSIPYFLESEAHRYLVSDPKWNERHVNFVDEIEIQKIHKGVSDFLESMDESVYSQDLEDLFANYSIFINSALGHAPAEDKADADIINIEENIRTAMITPYRVTEAFYWLLAENSVLPRNMTKKYRNTKTKEERTLSFLYYKNYDQKYIDQKTEALRARHKIKDSLLGGNWELQKPDQPSGKE